MKKIIFSIVSVFATVSAYAVTPDLSTYNGELIKVGSCDYGYQYDSRGYNCGRRATDRRW